jgi:hypothetical protein
VGSPPHVHSSRLVPVSFAGFLIKCLRFISTTWAFAQARPHVALRGRLRAVWARSSRGVLSPVFLSFSLPMSYVCRPAAVRHGYVRHLGYMHIRPWGAGPVSNRLFYPKIDRDRPKIKPFF